MQVQETATSAVTSLLGSAAAVLAGLAAAAAIGFGIEYVTSALDLDLPLRQLMLGRNWALYRRFICAVVGSFRWSAPWPQ